MRRSRDGLRHAVNCPAPSYMECPTFRRLLRDAGAGLLAEPQKQGPGVAF